MISFQTENGNILCVPWHQVQEIRITKRFPTHSQRFGEFNARPIYVLTVNGNIFGRYVSFEDALAELHDIEWAYSSNRPYRISRALTDERFQELLYEDESRTSCMEVDNEQHHQA